MGREFESFYGFGMIFLKQTDTAKMLFYLKLCCSYQQNGVKGNVTFIGWPERFCETMIIKPLEVLKRKEIIISTTSAIITL